MPSQAHRRTGQDEGSGGAARAEQTCEIALRTGRVATSGQAEHEEALLDEMKADSVSAVVIR
ncbi:hypothetical protein ACFYWU_14920 [Streptomyces chrestomyceticus]|uniref:hypothetical protein n=1 Tax=Streptomyces chrestomyceticus TaxID=68185 RepID=UPI00368D7DB4